MIVGRSCKKEHLIACCSCSTYCCCGRKAQRRFIFIFIFDHPKKDLQPDVLFPPTQETIVFLLIAMHSRTGSNMDSNMDNNSKAAHSLIKAHRHQGKTFMDVVELAHSKNSVIRKCDKTHILSVYVRQKSFWSELQHTFDSSEDQETLVNSYIN
eukprot:m.76265 g.76265  ORF g.76265 m.76265 type:complete len:154 (+) comp11872_c0_seq1:85-546(+)